MPGGTIQIGRLRLNPHRELYRGDRSLPIGARALAVLSELADADGDLVTKDRLMARVWPEAVVEDNALQAQVSQLRRIMGAEAARLVAVHGRGYRLELDRAEAAPEAPGASVAVLPFANLTGDPDKAYLADGIAEELIGTLARSPEIKVPARTSSFAYRGRDVDVRTIAGELGVETVVEGSVRSAGERIRVTAQLIEAESGFHLWGRNYDRDFGDLFALQDEIAGAIATALKAELGVEQPREPEFQAYHMYLRARGLFGTQGPVDLETSLGLLDEAIERDPGFARAYAERAFAIHLGMIHGLRGPEWGVKIAADADKALELDPQLGRIHALRGLLRAGECNWCAADREYRLALESQPPDPYVSNGYNSTLTAIGYLARALRQVEESVRLAPAFPIATVLRAMVHSLQGDVEAADDAVQFALKLGMPIQVPPMSPIRAQIAVERGDFATAAEAMSQAIPPALLAIGGQAAIDHIYAALAGSFDRTTAAAEVQTLFDTAHANGVLHVNGVLYAFFLDWLVRLGDLDRAFAVADGFVAQLRTNGFIVFVALSPLWNPWMRPFREDPRFQDFARALNMFEYWERHGPLDGHALEGGGLVCI